jgi:cell division GTPase FtsZ
MQQLNLSDAPVKIHIGEELTQGLGSGADPETGRLAAEEAYDQVRTALRGSSSTLRSILTAPPHAPRARPTSSAPRPAAAERRR